MNESLGLLQAIVLLALLAIAGMQLIRLTSRTGEQAHVETSLFLVALAARFAASLAIYEFGFVGVIKDEDASDWTVGVVLYQQWSERGLGLTGLIWEWTYPLLHPLGNTGYEHLLATVFYFTEMPARLPAAVINNFFGAMTVIVSYRLAGALCSEWVAIRAAWILTLMPSMIMWSAQTLKEPAIILLQCVALLCCVRIRSVQRRRALYALLCASAIGALLGFRFYAAYIMAAAVVVTLLVPRLEGGDSSTISGLIVAGLLAALVINAGVLGTHLPVVQGFDLQRFQDIRDWTARNAGSGVPLGFELTTPYGFVMSALIGAAHVLFAPFPWQLGGASLRMLLTFPDVLLWWWLAVQGLVPGFVFCVRHRLGRILPVLMFLAPTLTLYGIMFSNVGLSFRYRAQLMPYLMTFAIAGLEQRARHRERVRLARSAHWATARGRTATQAAEPREIPATR